MKKIKIKVYNKFRASKKLKRKLNQSLQHLSDYAFPAKYSIQFANPNAFRQLLTTDIQFIKKQFIWSKRKLYPRNRMVYDINWEEAVEKFSFDGLNQTVRDIFLTGKPKEETIQYKRMINAVRMFENGETDNPSKFGAYWCRSYQDVERYFEILKSCYESAQKEGFLSQKELLLRSGEGVGGGKLVRSLEDEIKVLIDNKGDFVFSRWGANHRFSIAKILDAKSVPVILTGVSKKWLDKQFDLNYFSLKYIIDKCITKHPHLSIYKTCDETQKKKL